MKYLFLIIPIYGIYVLRKKKSDCIGLFFFMTICIILGIAALVCGQNISEFIAGVIK